MMKAIYTILIILVSIFVLFYCGCNAIGWAIGRVRDCKSFTIDNFEIRTETDIKDGYGGWCHYNDTTLTKDQVFYMDIDDSELHRYITINEFQKTQDTIPVFTSMPIWNDSLKRIPARNLFYKKGSYKSDSWLMVLDSATTTLWAELIETKKS